jgi:hypothetical protein
MRREQGSVLAILMALLAAMTIVTTIVIQSGVQEHRLAKQSHLRAVARNLAEAAIVAGRQGQAVPQAALNEGLAGSGLRATVRLDRRPLPDGKLHLTATAELEPGGLRYRIELETRRGPGGRLETVAWRERQLP